MSRKAFFYIIPALVLYIQGNLIAQVPADIFAHITANKPGQGTVQIRQSNDISSTVRLHLLQMSKLNGIRGYRVCIYYNSGQESSKKADQERARFISRYEDVSSDKVLESPFWKVYVGNFRTKSEALKFLDRIRFDYPNAFIRDNIIVAFPK